MSDFDQHSFATQSFIGIVGIASIVAASVRSPASIIDEQRIRDHEILNSQLAQARSVVARRRIEAALANLAAAAELRRAAVYVGIGRE